jgi:hypothetical protein
MARLFWGCKMKITSSGVFPDLLNKARLAYAPGIGGGWLQTAILPDGVHEILLEEFRFTWCNRLFIVPKAFVTDFASVPRFFHRILPQRGRYSPAAVAHDWLYWSGRLSRKQADKVLYDLARRLKVRWIDRQLLYWGVRLGGWVAWNAYREQQKRVDCEKVA